MRHSSQDTHTAASSPVILPEGEAQLSSSMSSLMSTSSTHSSSFRNKASNKRPRQEKCVHFAETATLHVVSNHRIELSREELYQVYYSRRELETLRRKSRQLVETFEFYSDEDLMDRFGLPSAERQMERVREIYAVRQCVMELEFEHLLGCLGDEKAMTDVDLLEESNDEREHEPIMHQLVEEYYRKTALSTQLAIERAERIQEQAAKTERSGKVLIV